MEPIGFISHETLARLQDPEWQKQRGDVPDPAVIYTVNNPPSRCVLPVYLGREPLHVRIWKRLRCWVTLNHIDPAVTGPSQTHMTCKGCGKVWRVWK